MNIRKTMLAAAIAAFAFAAMPALASADPQMDFTGSKHFTISGGTAQLTSHTDTVHCTSVTGTGEFTNSETGTISFVFHGCKDELGFSCTSTGHSAGTITSTSLTFHLVTITNGEPGVLITPAANEHFAGFTCFIIGVTVTGNGIIGEITQGYNEPFTGFTVDFKCKNATEQVHMTHDGDPNTDYDLRADIGEETETACEEAEGTATFTEGGEGKLTEA